MGLLHLFLVAVVLHAKSSHGTSDPDPWRVKSHTGVNFQPVPSIVYRGSHYIDFTQPLSEIGNLTTITAGCGNYSEAEMEKLGNGHNSLLCTFLKQSSELLVQTETAFRNTIKFLELEGQTRRKRNIFGDIGSSVVKLLLGQSETSQLSTIVTSEQALDEHLREIRFNAQRQTMTEGNNFIRLNDWSEFINGAVSNLTSAQHSLQLYLRQEIDKPLQSVLASLSAQIATLTQRIIAISRLIREQSIMSDCSDGRIPFQAVSMADFQLLLRNVSKSLASEGKQLAIPSTQIRSYVHQRHIATCFFSSNTLTITVMLPILFNKDTGFFVYNAVALYFVWEKQQCNLLQKSEQVVLVNHATSETVFLSPAESEVCLSGRLCKIPRVSYPSKDLKCLNVIATGKVTSHDALKTVCTFQCDGNEPATRVVRTGLDKFSVSSYSNELKMECNNSISNIDPVSVGSRELTVPCQCSLIDSGVVLITPSLPCSSDPSEKIKTNEITLPAFWRNSTLVGLPKLNINDTDEVLYTWQKNYSDALDENWKTKISQINLDVPTYRTEEGGVWEDLTSAVPHVSLGNSLWNLFLTCVVICICVKLYKFFRNYRLSKKRMNSAVIEMGLLRTGRPAVTETVT